MTTDSSFEHNTQVVVISPITDHCDVAGWPLACAPHAGIS